MENAPENLLAAYREMANFNYITGKDIYNANGGLPDPYGGIIPFRAIDYVSGVRYLAHARVTPGTLLAHYGILVVHGGVKTEYLFPYPVSRRIDGTNMPAEDVSAQNTARGAAITFMQTILRFIST